ncbi:MAG: CD1845 family protein [Oscillospiraceae bacterium]|nr:CD1845 family protein [Oscillospiraceae bacterium]
MRILMKILFAPVIIVLTLFVWICSGLLYCSAWVFGLAGTLLSVLAIAVLITTSVQNGIILLVMAFIVSPFGIPMIAVKLLGLVQRFRFAIQDRVY